MANVGTNMNLDDYERRELAYKLALEKFPEIKNRKIRRASWHEARREQNSTHAVAARGEGTHAARTRSWRETWAWMSSMAAQLERKRRYELLNARING